MGSNLFYSFHNRHAGIVNTPCKLAYSAMSSVIDLGFWSISFDIFELLSY